MVIPLSHLEAGQRARIVWIASEDVQAARLACLGFAPGRPVTCVLKSKKGRISAFLVEKSVIALRRDEASEILVKPED